MHVGYYANIPANVRYDKELTPNAKLLYGEITALCNKEGYCWASNLYFAELYGVSKVSISKWINQLCEKGYIHSDIHYKEGSKEILNRYLRIVNYPIKEKFNTPIKEKFKDNTTSFNTTSNKNNAYSDDFEQFWSIYPRKVDKKKAYKSFKACIKKHKLEQIIKGTEQYSKMIQLKKTELDYVKYPATFLNNESYMEMHEQPKQQDTPNNGFDFNEIFGG